MHSADSLLQALYMLHARRRLERKTACRNPPSNPPSTMERWLRAFTDRLHVLRAGHVLQQEERRLTALHKQDCALKSVH